jgi:hypothetical protein
LSPFLSAVNVAQVFPAPPGRPEAFRFSAPAARESPYIPVFHAKYVAAMREKLVARGARFGKVRQGQMFCLCDGKDPDGNPFQL